jgi:hypothetical protein
MNDDRIEQLLRDWLSAEDAATKVPARMRTVAASARASAMPVSTPRGRLTWPRGAGLAAGAVVVALAILLSVTLAGVLPLGRPDCSGVTIDGVRAAVVDVAGYSWRMTGSELVSRLIPDPSGPPAFAYNTEPLEFEGVYNAPDAWRLEVIQGYDPAFIVPPTVGQGLVSDEVDGYLVVQGQAYVRPTGAINYRPAADRSEWLLMNEANELYGLLYGLEFRVNVAHEASLSWDVAPAPGGCLLSATPTDWVPQSGAERTREVTVDPRTLLPAKADLHVTMPEEIPSDPQQGFGAQFDQRLSFTYRYTDVPHLEAPFAGPLASEQQARSEAQGLGIGELVTSEAYQLGSAQAFAVHGRNATAVLVYEDGQLTSTDLVPNDVGVWVQLVRSEQDPPAVFLVSILNDPRVASVEVYFSSGETRTPYASSGVTPEQITSGEGLGDLLTWTAFDENGGEVNVSPPPP